MKERLHVVDALRGFAIISIMLLHNIEHFDFYFMPQNLPAWMVSVDSIIWDTLFFLFGGKSFAMFALLFGLTFFIQFDNQAKKNKDFRLRFAWRMLLLLGFGIINSAFFEGDILTIYAALGLFLIPIARLNNKWLLAIAIILLFQPLEIYKLIQAIQNPEIVLPRNISGRYFGKIGEYLTGDSLIDTLKGNITNGKMAILHWNWENGRYFQILSLFIFGYISGRRKLFVWSDDSKKVWRRILIISSVAFIPLFLISKNANEFISSRAILSSFVKIWTPFSNLSFMLILVSGFTLLFHSKSCHKILNILSPVGKMSLSNYIFQSIIGACIYYGFGLGLYKYTGATYSLLIGILLSTIFVVFCTYWSKKYKYGPLEKYWHAATWISFKKEKTV